MKLIKQIAENQKQSVYNLIHLFQEILFERVAPRKHCKLRHYTTHSQIGILEGVEFCSSTKPQLFTLNMSNQDHSNLFQGTDILIIKRNNKGEKKFGLPNMYQKISK